MRDSDFSCQDQRLKDKRCWKCNCFFRNPRLDVHLCFSCRFDGKKLSKGEGAKVVVLRDGSVVKY